MTLTRQGLLQAGTVLPPSFPPTRLAPPLLVPDADRPEEMQP